jgi:hypothetical protein
MNMFSEIFIVSDDRILLRNLRMKINVLIHLPTDWIVRTGKLQKEISNPIRELCTLEDIISEIRHSVARGQFSGSVPVYGYHYLSGCRVMQIFMQLHGKTHAGMHTSPVFTMQWKLGFSVGFARALTIAAQHFPPYSFQNHH